MPRLGALARNRAEPSRRAPIANQMMRGRGFFYAAHDNSTTTTAPVRRGTYNRIHSRHAARQLAAAP